MTFIRPWNEDGHAIVQVAFAVDFSSNPSPQAIRDLLALHSKLREAYPRKRETTGHLFGFQPTMEAEQKVSRVGTPELTGFTFDSLEPDGGVKRAITLKENKLSVTQTDYETWEKTWGKVRNIFALMLPVLIERSDVEAIHLQYHDRFVWSGDRASFRAEIVFREGSGVLVPNVFEVPEIWHSYHGYFEYPDEPQKHQRLNVVEARVVTSEHVGLPEELGLVAEVRLSHRSIPGIEKAGAPGKPLKTVPDVLGEGDATGPLDTYMNEMHDKDIWLLARLINDEMCDKIGVPRPE